MISQLRHPRLDALRSGDAVSRMDCNLGHGDLEKRSYASLGDLKGYSRVGYIRVKTIYNISLSERVEGEIVRGRS